jgi:hypothetical protein
VGTEPVDPDISDFRGQISDFCREIETYLCKKNDGHLIRVVGPSFERVSGWAQQGIPLKVAFAGIDRYFERYYRKGPRRRPVKIDFCDADVLDVFDEWRRATGQSAVGSRQSAVGSPQSPATSLQSSVSSRQSLPEHLERVVTKLSSARASGSIGDAFDAIIDRAATELDAARGKPGGIRGDARAQLLARLADLDRAMMAAARAALDAAVLRRLQDEAETELAPFRSGMATDEYARAHVAAVDHLVRLHLGLPILVFA